MANKEALFRYIRQLEEMEQQGSPYPSTITRETFKYFRQKFLKAYKNQQASLELDPRVTSNREKRENAERMLGLIVQILCQLANVTYLHSTKWEKTFEPNDPVEGADPKSFTFI